MSDRPPMPAEIKRDILIECGHRCAVCGIPFPLQLAHIIPWRISKEHKAEDMICLCANCHERADKDKWSEKTLREYKRRPWVMRHYDKTKFVTETKTGKVIITVEEIPIPDEKSLILMQLAIAGFLEISPNAVQLTSVEKGSIKIRIELPYEAAERLLSAYQENDPELYKYLAWFVLIDLRLEVTMREQIHKRNNFDKREGTTMDENTFLPNLPQLEWVQTLRDPIWGEIPITEVEKKIIQTEAFYRLRGIKQLGFSYLAFPGAVHSRFEHSLGVMHATDMLLKMVTGEQSGVRIQIGSFDRQILRLAALMHDIGHPPFSHAIEELFTYYPDLLRIGWENLEQVVKNLSGTPIKERIALGNHEAYTLFIICENNAIKNVIEEWIRKERKGVIAKNNLDNYTEGIIKDVISKLAVGELVDANKAPGNIVPLIRIFKSIMSGDIDADKIDYLMRDNYYCGLPHGLDLASLRNQLIPHVDGLEIRPEAIRFVHSLILARYRLITEVHHNKWDVFATAKAIEILHKRLPKEEKAADVIFEIFTKWDDSKLLNYLLESGDKTIKALLTTQYPLKELARLEYIETHPYIRECIQILSEPINHHQIPKLQEDLRMATGKNDLFIHIQSVKSPEFSMKIVGGDNLLRDEILRGISEESIKNLHLVVYGGEDFQVDLKSVNLDFLPCENCVVAGNCVNNLIGPEKKLLAELAVRRYRLICEDCGKDKIIAADFLLLIMEKVNKIAKENKIDQPIRQNIYKIAQLIFNSLSGQLKILGTIDLDQSEITSSFYQEIRKYEQLGLIAYSREIRKLLSEDGLSRDVFRYDRRFQLSEFGTRRLENIRKMKNDVKEYVNYMVSWNKVEKVIKKNEPEIIRILQVTLT